MDDEMRADLARRLDLIEAPGGPDAPLRPLPLVDVLAAVAGLAGLTCALLWWALR